MQAALADYQQVVLRSFGQVADALESLDHDQELLDERADARSQTAARTWRLTRESYSAGNSGVLQVLEAQRQNQQARLGLVRAQAQRFEDTVQLLLALGGRDRPRAEVGVFWRRGYELPRCDARGQPCGSDSFAPSPCRCRARSWRWP